MRRSLNLSHDFQVTDPYLIPGYDCLRNNLGLTDPLTLDMSMGRIVALRDAQLRTSVLPGLYDLKHLQQFHQKLFVDVFDWAGEIRSIDLSKGIPFAFPHLIEVNASTLLAGLAAEKLLAGLDRVDFLERLTFYLGEVNALHPFREGNGRTQRAFFRQLSAAAGWRVDWTGVTRQVNDQASYESLVGRDTLLRTMLDGILSPL